MPSWDRGSDQGEGKPESIERQIDEARAERDAYRLRANWDDLEPTAIPDRQKYHGAPEPWTPEELARMHTDEDRPTGTDVDDRAADAGDPERLHAFGRKDAPRPPRPDRDLGVDSWDAIVGPYAPGDSLEEVKGASTYIDPNHPEVDLSGKFHRLPPDYVPPKESGLAIHADGTDVHPRAPHPWGHRTIYPTEPMTAAEFAQRFSELPWEYAGNKKTK